MKIRSIEIKNFRSYAGANTFEINPGLTLIIGANGEGKTNLYDAMEWLFDTKARNDARRIVSKKAVAAMGPADLGETMVAIDFEHNDSNYRIEKSFAFTKADNDTDIKTGPFNLTGYEETDYGRVPTDGARLLDRCFNASIRHFSLMAGEESLKVLNQHATLQYLIHTFSAVRHADRFTEFTVRAADLAQRANQNAISKNSKNKRASDRLTREIETLDSNLRIKQKLLENTQNEARNYATQIEAIVNSGEASAEMRALESRLEHLQSEKARCKSRIHDNYTVGLLDDMLVLAGIMPVLDQYSDKVAEAERLRREEEHDYFLKKGEQKALEKMRLELENGAAPLPLYAPDEKFMREMLRDHICKVCGTPAPEGSQAYRYISNKLEAYRKSLETKKEEKPAPCFPNSYIPNLAKLDTLINNDKNHTASIFIQLQELIHFNEERKQQLRSLEDNIAQVEEDQRKLQARVPGVSKEVLLNNFTNLTNWNKHKSECELRIAGLKDQIANLQNQIDGKRAELNKLAASTPAAIYARIADTFNLIKESFRRALLRNKTEFIRELEKTSNSYLAKLNVGDFKGTVHIYADAAGAMHISLIDADGTTIDPNKALETTMYMSVLFAVSELTEIKKDDEYPLMFDAPTSSFAVGKEKDFFRIIDNLDKQIIIVTKSFLKEAGPNHYVLDQALLEDLDLKGTVYRIEKKKPFDDKNQATVQTLITKIR